MAYKGGLVVSASMKAIMTMIATWTTIWFTISLIPSDSNIVLLTFIVYVLFCSGVTMYAQLETVYS